MSASEKFLRFAAECETMASLARDRESRLVWRDFANRWNRYAQSVEFRLAKAQIDRMKRPHRRPALDSSSSGDAVLVSMELRGERLRHRAICGSVPYRTALKLRVIA